jgi:hypothetical protein
MQAELSELARSVRDRDFVAAAGTTARAQRLHDAQTPFVSVALAARLLSVSETTVRTWADKGLFCERGTAPRKLSLASVVSVRGQLASLRKCAGGCARPSRSLRASVPFARPGR